MRKMNHHTKSSVWGFAFLLFITIEISAQKVEPLFDYWKYYSDADNSLYKHLSGIAFEQLDKREKKVLSLHSKSEVLEYQKSTRARLDKVIGPFPEKTPLNPEITGKIKGDGFVVEKILFESRPDFFVTATLFLPAKRKGKLPAVIYCSGHTWEGFRSKTYQHVIINLVKKGFVVFAFDPIGQGERMQYLDPEGKKSTFGSPTHEHSYAGAQCFITGSSMAKYMIWDGIRSVDYLVSRKEVDPERIGITGRSGGGTQSSYIAAFDPRIKAVAPENYITSFEMLLKTRGPQDAEQNFPGGIANGIDHADLLEVRAPKPTLIISTYNDFFNYQGVLNTFKEVKDFYSLAGSLETVNMVADEGEHQSTQLNREALYRFFQKHLDLPGNPGDIEVTPFDSKQLNVTKTGQVLSSFDGESVFSLNRKKAQQKVEKIWNERNNNGDRSVDIIEKSKTLSGYESPEKSTEIIHSGRQVIEEAVYTRYLVKGSGDYYLPVISVMPKTPGDKDLILYFDSNGKDSALSENKNVADLINSGYPIILSDLPGIGELGPGFLTNEAFIDKVSYRQWYAGILTNKSILGLRSQDINILLSHIKTLTDYPDKPVTAVADGFLTTDLVHACAFKKGFDKTVLINPLVSWEMIVSNEKYDPTFIPSAVPGA